MIFYGNLFTNFICNYYNMKKILITIILASISFSSYSQTLSKKQDPFTKAIIISTKPQILFDAFFLGTMVFNIRKVDSSYLLGFTKVGGVMYSVDEGEKAIVLCKSGKTYDIFSRAFQQWTGSGNFQRLNHEYRASEDVLKKIIDDEPTGVRFYNVGGSYIDIEIKERRRSIIPDQIKVILGLKAPDNIEN